MNWYSKYQHYEAQNPDLAILDLEDELNALLQRLRDKYPLSELEAWVPQGRYIDLARINVKPENRNQGVGNAVMREIQDFAKVKGLPIRLSPEPERGKKEALERFYRSLGFKWNKGRSRDFQLSSPFAGTMFWKPDWEENG